MSDITLHITDRQGKTHNALAPTDITMNLMEVVSSYELVQEGTIGICGGMAICTSCQCYITSNYELLEMGDDEDAILVEAFYVKDNSRLGGQIAITTSLNGFKLELAPE